MIEVTIVGEERISARLDSAAGPEGRARLVAKVQRLGIELQRRVKEQKLSGQVLNVRSGTLRRSINQSTTTTSTSVTSSVGTAVPYGAAWELGFERRVGPGARGGGTIGLGGAGGTRKYGPRRFLGSSLAEMRDRVIAVLSEGGLV